MAGKPITSLKKSSASLAYELKYGNQEAQFKNLMYLIPSESLIGPNDRIPGIKSSALSARFNGFDEALVCSDRKTLYAHDIRISSMNDIEKRFSQYLRSLCMDGHNGAA